MKVGCVKEIKTLEFRVGMTPDNAKSYINAGHKVYCEKGLGVGSGFEDSEYSAVGAIMCDHAKEVWETCDMIVKVKEPLEPEYELMREGQILYTYLHLAADRKLTEALLNSKTTGVAYETLSVNKGLPLLRPMSEVAGRLSVQEGAKYLEKQYGGRGILLGGVPGVPPAKVVVLGAGVVGTHAAKMAIGMHADVTIMDVSLDRLVYLSDVFGASCKTMYSTDANIERELQDADLVISSALIPGAAAPKLIKAKYLKTMKKGAVIVDPAIDQGGTTEVSKVTYHNDPVYIVDDVVIYSVANMPGACPRTSTLALTNATLKYGLAIASNGLEDACVKHPEIVSAINTKGGKVTYKAVADQFEMEYCQL